MISTFQISTFFIIFPHMTKEKLKTEITFLNPYGFCQRLVLDNWKERLLFESKKQIKVIIIDPYVAVKFRAVEVTNAFISTLPSGIKIEL